MELVAGSYEQVLFGFRVHREPATSGDREVRRREPRGGGGGRGGRSGRGGLVPSRADTAAPAVNARSPWIVGGFAWITGKLMPGIPALERLRQDRELKACVERPCSLQSKEFSEVDVYLL